MAKRPADEVIAMTSKFPKTEKMNTSKVAGALTTVEDVVSSGLRVATMPKRNVAVTVDLYNDGGIALSRNISAYEMAIMDSVYTIMQNGSEGFTPELVARVMAGDPNMDVTPQKKAAVTQAIRRLSVIRIKIDCSEELRARKQIKPNETAIFETYLLPVKYAQIMSGNHTKLDGFKLIETPALYEYAERCNQIMGIPTEILALAPGSHTDENIVLRRYLIKRIEGMKNDRNHLYSNRIAYEWHDPHTKTDKGLLAVLGYQKDDQTHWRRKKMKIHHEVVAMLTAFRDVGYIKGFDILKSDRNEIVGYEIEPAGTARRPKSGNGATEKW